MKNRIGILILFLACAVGYTQAQPKSKEERWAYLVTSGGKNTKILFKKEEAAGNQKLSIPQGAALNNKANKEVSGDAKGLASDLVSNRSDSDGAVQKPITLPPLPKISDQGQEPKGKPDA